LLKSVLNSFSGEGGVGLGWVGWGGVGWSDVGELFNRPVASWGAGATAAHVAKSLRNRIANKGKKQGPRQPPGPPPWGDRCGAAGIVALQNLPHGTRVCLVEKRNGQLGFPKGRAESCDSSAMQTAFREWREEAMLSIEELQGLHETRVFVDSWGCHYFFAEYVGRCNEEGSESWEVKDDPLDKDPIVRAHWMLCPQALSHHMLSKARKDILRIALQTEYPATLEVAADHATRQPRRCQNR